MTAAGDFADRCLAFRPEAAPADEPDLTVRVLLCHYCAERIGTSYDGGTMNLSQMEPPDDAPVADFTELSVVRPDATLTDVEAAWKAFTAAHPGLIFTGEHNFGFFYGYKAGLAARGDDTEALARAWDEGYRSGASNVRRQWSDEPNAPNTPNPYRIEGSDTDD